jgi:hypothetical protein
MAKQRLLDTDTSTLDDILSTGKLYRVPLYQRDYSWGADQWEALWQDVLESRSAPFPHYMGALVLQRVEREPTQVIDGQQRLATIIIACVAVLDLLEERGENERLALLRARYVGSPDPGSLRWQSKLSMNETDDAFFQEFIINRKQLAKSVRPRSLRSSHRKMWDARVFFRGKWAELVPSSQDGQALVDAFQETMGVRLSFTTITVDDELNAYSVFETLNARSLQLTSTDLLKNYLFSLLKGGRVDLDQASNQWRRIVEKVEAEALPAFLRQFWISKHKLVRADRLFKALKGEVTTREGSFGLLDDLENAAGWYRALGDPNDELWVDQEAKDCRAHVRVLNLFDVSQHYPLLIACLARGFELSRISTILRICLVVFFRHTLVAQRSPSELEARFNQLAMGVSSGKLKSPKEIWVGTDGQGGLRELYVSDDSFRESFARLELRRGGKAKLPRYILLELDHAMGGPVGDFETSPETIEHVLPENPGSDWVQFSEEDRKRFTNVLGNYVLLGRAANKALGTANFATKASTYRLSPRPTTQMVDVPSWSPQAIIERQAKLAEVAATVWRIDL